MVKAAERLQVGLNGNRRTALGDISGKNLRQVALSVSGRHDRAVFQGILDVQIADPAVQHFPGLKGILSALNEVCGIENAIQVRKRIEQVQTAGGIVAVNALFVLVTQTDAGSLAEGKKSTEVIDDGITIVRWIFSLFDIVGEETDVFRFKDGGNLQRAAEGFRMGGVISVHRDLADGGADGPDTQSVVTELPVDLFRLGKRNVRNVHPVHAPDFKALKLIA